MAASQPNKARVGVQDVAIQDIWIMREGGESDPLAEVVVYVQREGVWYEAIREFIGSNFSHCISANGLVSNSCAPAAWLNEARQAQESNNHASPEPTQQG